MHRRTFIYTFALGSGSLLTHQQILNGMNVTSEHVKITMIYNNIGKCEGLENEWGLAAWIESPDGITLFDTGGRSRTLQKNMEQLHLDPAKVERIIISHDHWDHKGGLAYILEHIDPKTPIYVPHLDIKSFEKEFPTGNFKAVEGAQKITKHLWSTGTMSTTYKLNALNEHALVILNGKSMMLLTGCSHPGIVKMSKQAIHQHPEQTFELVTGGFHLMRETNELITQVSTDLKNLGIKKAAPSHCTGDNGIEIFRNNWKEDFININLGDSYTH
jgi:7,8-dihydropterin-6-yl-methyl-4-(beta-D-ribofuranosyl)aminobenzene 5'-phosphate synthase